MTYLSNNDIGAAIRSMRSTIDADKHNGTRDFVLRELIAAGIIDKMPISALDPNRNLPADWSALQVSIFDNGEPELKRCRAKIQRTRMRFAGNIKLWTGTSVDFSSKGTVDWTKNFYLWDHSIAQRVADELHEDQLIDVATVELMRECVAKADPDMHFGIPVHRLPGKGTHWMSGHIMTVGILDGEPDRCALIHPEGSLVSQKFDAVMANGRDFGGSTIAQARIAREPSLRRWATDMQTP